MDKVKENPVVDDLRVAKPQSTRRGIVRSIDSHLWPCFLQVGRKADILKLFKLEDSKNLKNWK